MNTVALVALCAVRPCDRSQLPKSAHLILQLMLSSPRCCSSTVCYYPFYVTNANLGQEQEWLLATTCCKQQSARYDTSTAVTHMRAWSFVNFTVNTRTRYTAKMMNANTLTERNDATALRGASARGSPQATGTR